MQILLISALVLPAALYLLAWAVGLRADSQPAQAMAGALGQGHARPTALGGESLLLLLALLAHLGSLYVAVFHAEGMRFGFAHILSAALWVGALLLWVEGHNAHVSAMRAMVLPLAAICTPLPLIFPGASLAYLAGKPLFVPHLLIGVLSYAVMLLAAFHALLMATAERALHGRADAEAASFAGRYLDRLPPLLTLERILFRLLAIGFVLLSLTAVSGMFFSEEVFGRPFRFDHKTVFTLLAWGVFGLLLLGRQLWGWRGQRALRLTLAGFVVMLLGYTGSRFVLEVILHRT